MAGRADEVVAYHTHFLTNRGVGEAFDVYSSVVKEDIPVTRCRYVFLAIIVAVNLSMSIAVLSFAIHRHNPSARRWKLESQSSTTTGSDDWMACITSDDKTMQYCAVIDDEFCKATSKVTAYTISFLNHREHYYSAAHNERLLGSSEELRLKFRSPLRAFQ